MTDIKLTREEANRLDEITDAIDWRFTIAVKEHFNEAGKLQAFADAPTEAEKAEQKATLRSLFNPGVKGTLASIKGTELFVQVARRIGTDEELGALLPKGKLDEKDAALLEKCEMKSLAAIIRANKPAA